MKIEQGDLILAFVIGVIAFVLLGSVVGALLAAIAAPFIALVFWFVAALIWRF